MRELEFQQTGVPGPPPDLTIEATVRRPLPNQQAQFPPLYLPTFVPPYAGPAHFHTFKAWHSKTVEALLINRNKDNRFQVEQCLPIFLAKPNYTLRCADLIQFDQAKIKPFKVFPSPLRGRHLCGHALT